MTFIGLRLWECPRCDLTLRGRPEHVLPLAGQHLDEIHGRRMALTPEAVTWGHRVWMWDWPLPDEKAAALLEDMCASTSGAVDVWVDNTSVEVAAELKDATNASVAKIIARHVSEPPRLVESDYFERRRRR